MFPPRCVRNVLIKWADQTGPFRIPGLWRSDPDPIYRIPSPASRWWYKSVVYRNHTHAQWDLKTKNSWKKPAESPYCFFVAPFNDNLRNFSYRKTNESNETDTTCRDTLYLRVFCRRQTGGESALYGNNNVLAHVVVAGPLPRAGPTAISLKCFNAFARV